MFDKVDVFLAPTLIGRSVLSCNLTGHPCVVVPNGFSESGAPTSICFIGNLFREADLLALAKWYQDRIGFHRHHPKLD